MNLRNICCCFQSKNENLNLESKSSNAIQSNRLRIPSISVTITPEPIEPEDKNRPVFVRTPVTEQPKSTLKVETSDKDKQLKAKQPNIENIEHNTVLTENQNESTAKVDDLKKKYNGFNNFAFVDEIDYDQSPSDNFKIKNEQINYNDDSSDVESSINTDKKTNNCTCRIITTIENGKEIKKKIGGSENCKKCGIQNQAFESDETNINKNGDITPPSENEPTFEERRKSMIEKSIEQFFQNFGAKPQPQTRTKISDETDKISKLPQTHQKIVSTTVANIANIRLSCIELHNRLRAQHGCPPLKENNELNNLAEDWAHQIINNNCKLIHRSNNKYGENLYWTNSRSGHVTMAVYTWYDEIKLYDFNNPQFSKETGHFTQLIWRDTIELGTAVVTKGTDMIVVCNYNPPGNYNGEFNDYTVPQLIAEDQLTNDMILYYIKQIRESSLVAHNRLRASHGCPPLQNSEELDMISEEMLDHVERTGKIPKFRKNQDMAVNSAVSNVAFMHVTHAIQNWYDEGIKLYNYDERIEDAAGGFIQLIWRDTLRLGTAMRRIGDEIWVLCVYNPSRLSNNIYSDYLIPRPVTDKLHMPLEKYPKQIRWSCLEAHNRLRDLHGCPPLVENSEMNKLAEEWAEHLAQVNKLYHHSNSKYGENLYWTSDKYGHVTMAVKSWYDEIKFYDFNDPSFSSETGHFTQLIWKDSVEMGTGIARRGDSLYVVCLYNPPGNYVGRFNEYYIPRPIEY